MFHWGVWACDSELRYWWTLEDLSFSQHLEEEEKRRTNLILTPFSPRGCYRPPVWLCGSSRAVCSIRIDMLLLSLQEWVIGGLSMHSWIILVCIVQYPHELPRIRWSLMIWCMEGKESINGITLWSEFLGEWIMNTPLQLWVVGRSLPTNMASWRVLETQK